MERRQTWIAAAAVIATVILSAIGATWVIGRNIADMATREDVTGATKRDQGGSRVSRRADAGVARLHRPAPRATQSRRRVKLTTGPPSHNR